MPVSKAFKSVESRMPFKLCAPNAPKIMPKQIKIAPVTTYVLFIAQRCEKPMKLVSLMRYFMKVKFFFFVTLFIVFSCSEKNIEKKKSQTQIDYYQFREVNLVSFGIPATLMIPNETAGIGASFEPKIYHDDGGFKWHINVGRHFNIHIEDYGDYQYLMPEFLRRINTKDIFNIEIIEKTNDYILYKRELKVSPSEVVTYHLYGVKYLNGVYYEFTNQEEGDSKKVIDFIVKSFLSFNTLRNPI